MRGIFWGLPANGGEAMVAAFRRLESALADIFQEIEEGLRRDKAAQYWKRYGRYVVAAAVFAVAATASYVGWKEYRHRQQIADGDRFAVALSLIQDKKDTEALNALASLAQDAGAGYRTLARFRAATVKLRQGDRAGAVAIYDAIAKDGDVDPLYAQLAALYYVLDTLESGDPDDLAKRLEPLMAAASPWRYSARELAALLALRKGDGEKARENFTKLADDPKTPGGIRARAAEMLRALKQ
jgi:hypothetical protein